LAITIEFDGAGGNVVDGRFTGSATTSPSAAQSELTTEESIHPAFIHHEQDYIDLRAADLQTNTAVFNANSTRQRTSLLRLFFGRIRIPFHIPFQGLCEHQYISSV